MKAALVGFGFIVLVAGALGGYVLYQHFSLHAQAAVAADALTRMQERLQDGTLLYEPAEIEAEKEVQALSRIHPFIFADKLLQVRVSSLYSELQSARGLHESGDQLANSDPHSLEGANMLLKRYKETRELEMKDSASIDACLTDLKNELSGTPRNSDCDRLTKEIMAKKP